MRSVALALCLLTLSGCSLVLDPHRYQRDGGQSGHDGGLPISDGGLPVSDAGLPPDASHTPDAGSHDGGGGCSAPDQSCIPSVPAGWSGPVLLLSSSGDMAPAACPDFAPSTAFVAHSGLTAPSASCGCDCAEPSASQMSCGPVTVRSTSTCFSISGSSVIATVGQDSCNSVSGGMPSSGQWTASASTFSATGGCDPQPRVDVVPIQWDASHRGCGFGAPPSCGGGVCAPAPQSGQRLCVYVEGEATCPPDYPAALSTAEDVNDARDCSACTCGDIDGACSGSVAFTNGCSIPLLYAAISLAGCTAASAQPLPHYLQANFSPSGSCPPNPVSPTGAAEPTGTRTVCCLE